MGPHTAPRPVHCAQTATRTTGHPQSTSRRTQRPTASPVRALHGTLGVAVRQRAATSELSRAHTTGLVQAALPKPSRIVRK